MDLLLGCGKERGALTQEEAAARLGLSRSSIRTYEDRAYSKAKLISINKKKDGLISSSDFAEPSSKPISLTGHETPRADYVEGYASGK